ncbi:hypothetical protein ACP26L_35975 (plasmid) [Paenibacillus sp. S-38]|uniref:hypothetical protein n=1 Tax=Paenibacillus sp. S-38 TaxID=3416710 RepID=UPI003CEB9147
MSNQLYNDRQVEAIGKEFKRRLTTGEAEGPTVVVALVSMVKAGKLDASHMQKILNTLYADKVKILAVLIEAQQFLGPDVVDSIINEVRTSFH